MPRFRKMTAAERAALSAKLVQARKEAGLLQRDAARALGLPPSVLCALEQGQRRIDLAELAALASLYRKDPAWFFAGLIAVDATPDYPAAPPGLE